MMNYFVRCVVAVAIGLFLGSSAILIHQMQMAEESPGNRKLDVAPTRYIEISNACAAATGRYDPALHNALDGKSRLSSLIASLGKAKTPAGLSKAVWAKPCLWHVPQGIVVTLGAVTLGEKAFLRILDEGGGIKYIGMYELTSAADKCWPNNDLRPIAIDVGKARATVDWLYRDFGVVERHATQEASLRIQNTSDRILVADGFTTSCGCLSLSIPAGERLEIPPGGDLALKVSVKFGDVDHLSQSFRVRLSDDVAVSQADLVFRVFGSSAQSASWLPQQLDFGVVESIAEARPTRIRIAEAIGDELAIQSITGQGALKFKFDIASRVRADQVKEHLVECMPTSLVEKSAQGDLAGEIVISTSNKIRPVIRVPYRITVKQFVAASPDQ